MVTGTKRSRSNGSPGCCSSPHTRRCCLATAIIGGGLALLGLLLLVAAKDYLEKKILHSMALSPGSDRLATWLVPPVQAHLTGYGFHVTNSEEVMKGEKPILKEVGPFVYKAVTVKDSLDQTSGKSHLVYNDDQRTLTYKPRKFYYLDRDQSSGDPDTTYLTVPNIPLLTAFSKIKDYFWMLKNPGVAMVTNDGFGTPFINITFSGLLWGYEDAMPCVKMSKPSECSSGFFGGFLGGGGNTDEETPEGSGLNTDEKDDKFDFDFDMDEDMDMDMEGFNFDRKKRSARYKREAQEEVSLPNVDLRNLNFSALEHKEKAEFVNCKCNWGLFRDRNVTLRKPIKIHHGMEDLSKKGLVDEFDGKKTLDWWVPGSKCDEVGGQDTSTLPPGWTKNQSLDFYTSLMCRRIKLDFEKEMEHAGLNSFRYIPSIRQMASPDDPDDLIRNEDNRCYCVDGFSCLKSGVFNMEPCKRKEGLPKGAPIALSYPHFYQADKSYLEAVEGLSPSKEKHEFYVDVQPEFGFPLAIRPRFQLNAIIRKDEGIDVMKGFKDELVLPFLWAQDGFSEPSEGMAKSIKLGLAAPGLSVVAGAIFLCLGLGMVSLVLLWGLWQRKVNQPATEVYPLQ